MEDNIVSFPSKTRMDKIINEVMSLMNNIKMDDLKKQKLDKCEALDMVTGVIYCLKDIPPLNLRYA